MSQKRRKFTRPLGARRYRKLFILAVEGNKTEPQYFAFFNNHDSIIHVNCLRGKNKSAPNQVLARMEKYLKTSGLRKTDEAWLVVDKDQWTSDQLSQLHQWSQQEDNFGFALSNPKFEFWLLLHFEDGAGISSSKSCSQRLERYLPGYAKGIDIRKITRNMISDAINRANAVTTHLAKTGRTLSAQLYTDLLKGFLV